MLYVTHHTGYTSHTCFMCPTIQVTHHIRAVCDPPFRLHITYMLYVTHHTGYTSHTCFMCPTIQVTDHIRAVCEPPYRSHQCATGYPVPVPANPANIFQSGSGSGQILAGLAGFLKIIQIIQKFSKILKM